MVGVALGAAIGSRVRVARKARLAPSSLLAAQSAIARANHDLIAALHRSDPRGYVEAFAADAISLPPNASIVRGREAIAKAMERTFRTLRFVEIEMCTTQTQMNGDGVWEAGTYRYVVEATATHRRQTLRGYYAVLWTFERGRWRITLDAARPMMAGR